jgi:hypothetical protein
MKRSFRWLISLGLLVGLFSQVTQAQTWSDEIAVCSGLSADFDIDPITGHLHIICVQNGTGAYYVEMDNAGKIIRQEVIPKTEREQGGITYGPSIAVDRQGRPHVTFRIPEGGNYYSSYYTYRTDMGWSSPIPLNIDLYRGWVVRIDVDSMGYAHIARGSATNEDPAPMEGPVKYFKFLNGNLVSDKDGFERYRCDDRIEIDASYRNHVHMILGCPNYPPEGGPLWYWRSFDSGAHWTGMEIHHPQAHGSNGAPDLFVDAAGNVHIIYGSEIDNTIGGSPSVRYSRFSSAGSNVRDVAVTVAGEILERFDTPQGIGSVAASADGKIVMVAYSEDFGKRLFVRQSDDQGVTWGDRFKIAEESVGDLGRNRHTIRAYKSNFYIIYPTPNGIKLRYKKLTVNQPPVANAGGPYQGNEGSPVTFDASASSDPDGTIVKYEWDFNNDGTYDQTVATPTISYTYPDNYSGQVKLRVTDNENATATNSKNVTIANVLPKAEAGGPYSGEMNTPIQLNGSATDPGNDVLTYQWDLDNDNIYETNGQSPKVTFTTGGTHIVKLKVTDDDGGVGTDDAQVTISNKPPVVSPIPAQTIAEGGSFTPIQLDNYVTDPDNSDDQITWTASGMTQLNVTIANRVATISAKDPEWSGSETITFKATDPGGLSSSTSTSFTVTPVNDAPVMTQIPNQTINEGETFANVNLDDYVSDPDNADAQLTWTATGQNKLIVTINQRVAGIQTPNADWFGAENVTFKVTDPGGLSDSKTVRFTVNPVNDPPVVSQIPDQTIDQSQTFASFDLDNYVTDVDNLPNELTWSHNATQLVVNINNSTRVTTISVPNSNWSGSETITFTARDPGSLTGQSSATFTVGDFNDPPKVAQIPDQTITENGKFTAINLDLYVNDPDNNDSQIKWFWHGNKDLIIKEQLRVLTVSVPDSEWAGTEIVTFVATDPGGKKDSCITIFKVIAVNDPPLLQPLSDLYFAEDETLRIRRTELRSLVQDIDSPFEVLQFQLVNTVKTHYFLDAGGNMLIYADPNWFGTERVIFQVLDDKGGIDTEGLNLTVRAVPDPPGPISLLFPIGIPFPEAQDSIKFFWRKAYDPDPGDKITYQWSLSQDVLFEHIMDQYNSVKDSVFVYRSKLKSGIYYWRVAAFDQTGRYSHSSNVGVFTVGTSAVNADAPPKPGEYALLANYPNPFNPETRISFQIPRSCHVRLSVFNNRGQLIAVLVDGEVTAGTHTKIWNAMDMTGSKVTSGVYLYKLETKEYTEVRKMIFIQ